MEGAGDANQNLVSMKNLRQSGCDENKDTMLNPTTCYKEYADFHNARNSNRTKRKCSSLMNDTEENEEDGNFVDNSQLLNPTNQAYNFVPANRSVPKDEFSIHRKPRK